MRLHFKRMQWFVLIAFFFLAIAPVNSRVVKKTTFDETYAHKVAKFYHLNTAKNLKILKVKGYQQTQEYTCGPAAVMSLLRYYGKLSNADMNKTTEMKLAAEMHTSKKDGTSEDHMVAWLKKHGFHAKKGYHGTLEMLRGNLDKGVPTLVSWIDWGGHWVLVVGYNKEVLFLADPAVHDDSIKYTDGLNFINAQRFSEMWFNLPADKGRFTKEKGAYIIATPIGSVDNW